MLLCESCIKLVGIYLFCYLVDGFLVRMLPQFWVDFYVFSVVLGSGSTVAAADLLAMPQSTVSRKYRTFARSNGLTVLGRSGSYKLPPGSSYYGLLLQAFREFRRSSSQFACILSLSDEASRLSRVVEGDYSLYPGFMLFSSEVLPWMRDSDLYDFSLSVENIPSKSGSPAFFSGQLSSLADIHADDVRIFLKGFPFQFRELIAR